MKKRKTKSSRNPRADEKPDADPSVYELASIIEQEEQNVDDLYNNSYLSKSTIKRLLRGETRKPMGLTLRGIAEAAGYEVKFQRKKRGK